MYFMQCRNFTKHLNLILSIFIIKQVKFKQKALLDSEDFFHNGTYSEGGFMLHFPLSGRESCHCSG